MTGGCLSVGLLPDKPLRRSHAVAMLIKVFAGDGHDMMEVPLNKAQGKDSEVQRTKVCGCSGHAGPSHRSCVASALLW